MKVLQLSEAIKSLVANSIQSVFGLSVDIPEPARPPEMVDAEYAVACFPFAQRAALLTSKTRCADRRSHRIRLLVEGSICQLARI